MPEPPVHEKVLIKNSDGGVSEEDTMHTAVVRRCREGRTLWCARVPWGPPPQFKSGKQEGEAVFFDDIGQVMMKTPYKAGKLHGESTIFDPSGKIVLKENHEA